MPRIPSPARFSRRGLLETALECVRSSLGRKRRLADARPPLRFARGFPSRCSRRARVAILAWIGSSIALTPIGFAQQNPSDLGDPSRPLFSGVQERKPSKAFAPQNLPDLGDPSQALLSGAQERKLGESVMREVRAGGYLNDPEVNGYLNELGNRLVTAIPGTSFDFEFFAMADPSINAFALPGGFVGVNAGLILLTQTESELASVLAHEITHVTQHAFARSLGNQRDAMLATLGALAAAVLASRSGSSSSGDMTQAAIASAQGLALQSQITFTRENEEEADRIGFQRVVAAGFDPSAMATFMERLQRSTKFVEGNAPNYLRDHPVTYQRIAEAQARAESVPFRQVPDSLDFQMVRALLKSYEGSPRDAVLFFRDAIAERKYNNEIAAHYGLVASLLRAQDFKAAQAELKALEKTAPSHPMIEAIAGQVLVQSGQLKAAIARYEAALVSYPGKMQLVYDYPEALLKDHQPAKAAAFVDDELQRFPSDGPLHQIAAKAYAALGKQLLQHQHQAEFYAWLGNLKAAVIQLELAIKAGDGDFYQLSAVESRLRAVRQELADQQKAANSRRAG
ncbi:MAG TPA: M48 family metalloprotease [Casimicrobiaceae bacterium]